MPDTELDITSVLARISQLEERQNIVSKYVVGLKRQFDGMTEALQQIERLREQVLQLQQRFDQLPSLSNSLDDAETPNGVAESVGVDDAETVKQFFEQVEQQQHQEFCAYTFIYFMARLNWRIKKALGLETFKHLY
jgi:predicted nuclease with TOPRIM domain